MYTFCTSTSTHGVHRFCNRWQKGERQLRGVGDCHVAVEVPSRRTERQLSTCQLFFLVHLDMSTSSLHSETAYNISMGLSYRCFVGLASIFFFETLGWQGWADGLTRLRISAVYPIGIIHFPLQLFYINTGIQKE